MAAVFTVCQNTGQMIATGIETDEVSMSLAPSFVGRAFCPYCNADHEWTKATAWLHLGAGRLIPLK